MKKLIFAAMASVLLLSGCGVGNYSISSGKADESAISFTSPKAEDIVVTIDGASHQVKSVKTKTFKTDRKIKQTAQNTIRIAPGTHEVKVEKEGQPVFSKKLFLSASEHKVIEL